METSRQLHARDGEEERADRAYDIGEICRMSGYVDRTAVTLTQYSLRKREDVDALMVFLTLPCLQELHRLWGHCILWLDNHLHLSFS
jgi:hypothetical protein